MQNMMYIPSRFSGIRLVTCLAFFLFFIGQCKSQFRPPLVQIIDTDTVGAGYSFISQDDNMIENHEYLNPVFQELYTQRTEGGRKISSNTEARSTPNSPRNPH